MYKAQAGVLLPLVALLSCAAEEPTQYFDLVASFGRSAIQGDPSGDGPQCDPDSRLLFLPAGSELAYSFEGLRGSTLRADRVTTRGDGTELELVLSTDEAPVLFENTVSGSRRDWSLELPLETQTAARLVLRVDSRSAAPGDGVLLTAPALWGLAETEPRAEAPPFERVATPDVIIYLIDTLRRDRLGAYGYERPVSPNVDEFAAGATLFETAIGQASWTKPSLASMWTGVWPPTHGATGWGHRVSERFELLAETLGEAGYQTGAFVTNVNAGPAFGLAQGFDHVWFERKAHSYVVTDKVVSWLDSNRSEQPLFLYVHTRDPHAGYRPSEPYRSRFAPDADQMQPWAPRWKWPITNLPHFSNLYDGEIAQNDAAFGSLVEALRDRDLFDTALILVISDHGEEFKEHNGWRHGRVLHYGSLDVPIIVKFPGQTQGTRSNVPASHVDILPTALDVAGLAVPPIVEGQSLADPTVRPVFSHLRLGRAPLQYSVVDGDWKLIQIRGEKPRTMLFDLRADPLETSDLSAAKPVRTALLEGLLRERLAASKGGPHEEVELTEELRESLRELGYLQ